MDSTLFDGLATLLGMQLFLGWLFCCNYFCFLRHQLNSWAASIPIDLGWRNLSLAHISSGWHHEWLDLAQVI